MNTAPGRAGAARRSIAVMSMLAALATILTMLGAGAPANASAKPAAPRVDLAALAAATPIPASKAFAQFEAKKAAAKAAGVAAAAGCEAVTFKSGNFYVSAEFGWTGHGAGMLRARSQTVGPWETFGLCTYGSYYVISPLYEPSGRTLYVATEKEYTGNDYGMLRARSDVIGTWEQYTITWYGSGPDYISIKARANDKYVSTERTWTGDRFGMLRARSSSVGPWEQFQ